MLTRSLLSLLLVACCWLLPALPANASIFSFSGERPAALGVENGKLTECPPSPNCVSSQAEDEDHKIDAIAYETSADEAIGTIATILEDTSNANIITAEDNYIYAEFTSGLMGFVDDVEFYANPKDNQIEVRSASRLGESDLGVNRKRIEAIRRQFKEA